MSLDDYSAHEVLDRTYVLLDEFYAHVLRHEWVRELAEDDEVRHALVAAGNALSDAYNAVGKRHLS